MLAWKARLYWIINLPGLECPILGFVLYENLLHKKSLLNLHKFFWDVSKIKQGHVLHINHFELELTTSIYQKNANKMLKNSPTNWNSLEKKIVDITSKLLTSANTTQASFDDTFSGTEEKVRKDWVWLILSQPILGQ